MKHTKIAVVGAFLNIVVASSFAETITVATFNCEFLNTPKVHVKYGLNFDLKKEDQSVQDQWNDPAFRNQKYLESAKEVAKVIHSVNADIIALIEVGNSHDVDSLKQEVRSLGTDYTHSVVGDSKDTATHQNVAVFSKFPLNNLTTPIPGRESYIREPDDPETEDDTGISKGLRVNIDVNGKHIILYALHLSSERGGHERDMQRIAQASIARRHMLPDLNNGKLVIVAGDLNDKRGQPALHRIRGFDDLYPDLIQTGLPNYFEASRMDQRWTYVYQGDRQQIDHVLLSMAFKVAVKRSGIKADTMQHGNIKASDHRPFIVTLVFR